MNADEERAAHLVLLKAAGSVMYSELLARELLWLQRHSVTNDFLREIMSQVDASFRLFSSEEGVPKTPAPHSYSAGELQAELRKRLTSEECQVLENPLLVTDAITAEARSLTTGLTNPASKATLLLGYVIEERLKTEQQATNSATPSRLSEPELRNRANAGDLHAQMALAGRLFEAHRNDEALKWLLEAAKQGNAMAQENYGRNLHLLKKDSADAEAVEWLRKAALQGYSPANGLLATLLYAGKGVPQDNVEASMWAYLGDDAEDKECKWLLREMELSVDATTLAEGKKRAAAMRVQLEKVKTFSSQSN